MSKPRTVRAFSAGGVVFRRSPTDPDGPAQVVLVGRAWEQFWALPKGTPLAGEETPAVALREVAEESGILACIVDELGSVHYWFSRQGTRYNKEVFFYLMEATGGDVSQHDHEYDDVAWFPLPDALAHLTYANEAEILRTAAPRISARLEASDAAPTEDAAHSSKRARAKRTRRRPHTAPSNHPPA
jgi:8-oxo-dGTP pyrophosphatase MutT (NUDIX family)